MATRMRNNRRVLGDLTNRQNNRSHNVVKINRANTRKFGEDCSSHHSKLDQGNPENFVSHGTNKRSHVAELPKTNESIGGKLEADDISVDSTMSMETESSESDDIASERTSHDPCEIEMADAESPLLDIDKSDGTNPLAVVEYVEDIYCFYRKTETMSCIPADYMSNQPDINHRMRAILVDWLIEVHYKFELMQETLFLAINIIDRYLSRQEVTKKSLQLVGITGMLLACKYEEIFPPPLSDFVAISAGAYTREDVLIMEKSMLKSLQFNMYRPTYYMFMTRFLKAAESDTQLEMVSYYLLELCLVEYQMLNFPPSLVSAATIYKGRCMLSKNPPLNKSLQYHSKYTEEQLQDCVKLIEEFHQNAGKGKLTAVYRKYSMPKYNCIELLLNNFSRSEANAEHPNLP